MKKVLFCTMVVWATAACSLFGPREEKFVNPLFYKQILPASRNAREMFLTPTMLMYSNSVIYTKNDTHKDGWTVLPCELLENEKDYIVMKCKDIAPATEWRDKIVRYNIYRYQLGRCSEKNSDGKCTARYITEIGYDEYPSDRSSEITYMVELD